MLFEYYCITEAPAARVLSGVFYDRLPADPPFLKRGKITSALKSNSKLRQTLVVAQFAIAIVTLIIGTTVVYNQMRYVRKYRLGYAKDRVVVFGISDDSAIVSKRSAGVLKKIRYCRK